MHDQFKKMISFSPAAALLDRALREEPESDRKRPPPAWTRKHKGDTTREAQQCGVLEIVISNEWAIAV
jgi:hypothetical protein